MRQVSNASLIALLLTLFLGPFGAFFSYGLLAGDGFLNALLKFIGWSILLAAAWIFPPLIPVVYIVMVFCVFNATQRATTAM